ncbi:hypothetical protein CsSME_00047677 [Camellia sinensis var. sinensis]
MLSEREREDREGEEDRYEEGDSERRTVEGPDAGRWRRGTEEESSTTHRSEKTLKYLCNSVLPLFYI